MKKVAAIIPAAGSGTRLGGSIAKPYLLLRGIPLLAYPLRVMQQSRRITNIVVAVEPGRMRRARGIIRRFGISKAGQVIAGGATRSESVWNALRSLEPDTDLVLIHDAARPFISRALLDECIAAAMRYGAVLCAVRCAATIKSVDKDLRVTATLDRNALWEVQTPQVFSYQLIMNAYRKSFSGKKSFFDDASLIERLPHPVKVVPGSAINMKITTPDDLKIARAIARMRR
ncbi:MAG: 2-C-methyl-D-erythritol 4-phosphate cytidylyltransferase [Candidatus Omnitrophica bacterium]|nr:2-C-methyl-D-erythritol 4-phosphate cytidylyltransferase [Candidatus Omnitrophota bacterium]